MQIDDTRNCYEVTDEPVTIGQHGDIILSVDGEEVDRVTAASDGKYTIMISDGKVYLRKVEE